LAHHRSQLEGQGMQRAVEALGDNRAHPWVWSLGGQPVS
jgi:hypothetical protein